jgi:hypothetical protein
MLLRVPQAAPEQSAPERLQVTPRFRASFCTVAVNGALCVACTLAEDGATDTEIDGGGAVTTIVAVLVLFVNALEVAVTVIV